MGCSWDMDRPSTAGPGSAQSTSMLRSCSAGGSAGGSAALAFRRRATPWRSCSMAQSRPRSLGPPWVGCWTHGAQGKQKRLDGRFFRWVCQVFMLDHWCLCIRFKKIYARHDDYMGTRRCCNQLASPQLSPRTAGGRNQKGRKTFGGANICGHASEISTWASSQQGSYQCRVTYAIMPRVISHVSFPNLPQSFRRINSDTFNSQVSFPNLSVYLRHIQPPVPQKD